MSDNKDQRTMVRMSAAERAEWDKARKILAERSGLPELAEATFIRIAANEYANRVLTDQAPRRNTTRKPR